MTLSDYERHSAAIGRIVKAALRSYWQSAKDGEIDALEIANWIEALEDWPAELVHRALMAWIAEHPNRRPNHGHIGAVLVDARNRARGAFAGTAIRDAARAAGTTAERDTARAAQVTRWQRLASGGQS